MVQIGLKQNMLRFFNHFNCYYFLPSSLFYRSFSCYFSKCDTTAQFSIDKLSSAKSFRKHTWKYQCIIYALWEILWKHLFLALQQEYIICVDPVTQLGLNTDTVMEYSIGDIHRASDADTPELLPCGYLVGESDTISVRLKGAIISLL